MLLWWAVDVGACLAHATVSLPEELQARQVIAQRRVDELHAEVEELTVRLESAREDLSRLMIGSGPFV